MTATDVAARGEAAEGRAATPARPARRGRAVCAAAVVGLVGLSAVVQFVALRRDLPIHDIDEHAFVVPAVEMAATGDPNPGWFGHPGSTVIYPIAAAVHVWDVVAHGGPLLGGNPGLLERFERHPTAFYLIGRVWAITLALAALPVLYAVARRAFGRRVALVGTALWAVLPFPVAYGRMVRTESAAVFFGLVALWCCLRVLEDPRPRWWVAGGLAVGVAVSSRYPMATLGPVLVAAVVWPHRRAARRAVRGAAVAVAAAAAGFVLTTPYFLLDLRAALGGLGDEVGNENPNATGFSPLGNLRWYVASVIPDVVTWPVFVFALAGAAFVLVRRRPPQLLLLGYAALFLLVISASDLHWRRWPIPMLPVVTVLAAAGLDGAARAVAARWARTGRRRARPVALGLVATGAVALAVPLAADLVGETRRAARPGTRLEAREWLLEHVPAGGRVAQVEGIFGIPARTSPPLGGGRAIDYGLLPGETTVAALVRDGVGWVVVDALEVVGGIVVPDSPGEAEFYATLACEHRLVASFARTEDRAGPNLSVYRLGEPPERLLDELCRQPDPGGGDQSQ